jgi:Ser/Thr protein kinase RdoA (MazF antagonist)
MQWLSHTPDFDVESAIRIAEKLFGLRATAQVLQSERDQNFLLTGDAGEKFALKIANALESRDLLEAQNAALDHLQERVSFCPRVVANVNGETISREGEYYVRLVTYLPGTLLASAAPYSPALLRDLGRKLGQLDRALADFDHPALHRDFHWDLANGNRAIDQHVKLVENATLRELILKSRFDGNTDLRRSVIHGDANDYNVLVDGDRVVGIIDFGDMVYSWTVGNLAIALAYVALQRGTSADAAQVIKGYTKEFPLTVEERAVLRKLVYLRMAMSVCIGAYQRQQRPENKYLQISQRALREVFPRLFK